MKKIFVLYNIENGLYLTVSDSGGFFLTVSYCDCIGFGSIEEAEYCLTQNRDDLREFTDWEIKKIYITD